MNNVELKLNSTSVNLKLYSILHPQTNRNRIVIMNNFLKMYFRVLITMGESPKYAGIIFAKR